MATTDEETIAVLTRQLTAVEGSLKEIADFAASITEETLPSSEILEARDLTLDDIWKQASNVLLKLEGLKGSSPRRGPLLRLYIETKASLIRFGKAAEHKEGATGGFEPTPVGFLDHTISAPGATKSTHLPRIQLPKFSGSPSEWLTFKGRFEKRIATVTDDGERYIYLQSGLEHFEPALNACKAFEESGLSFAEAWKKLEERFYKRRLAFEGHF